MPFFNGDRYSVVLFVSYRNNEKSLHLKSDVQQNF